MERLRLANAAAEQRAQLEERRQAADGAKVAGNVAFQAQRFEEAAQHYSRGLEALGGEQARAAAPSLAAVLHCNRAAAHQACGRYLEALADCFRAAELDASYTRVYHRRADAYWALRAYDAAAQVGRGRGGVAWAHAGIPVVAASCGGRVAHGCTAEAPTCLLRPRP